MFEYQLQQLLSHALAPSPLVDRQPGKDDLRETIIIPACGVAACPQIALSDVAGDCDSSGSQIRIVTATLTGTSAFAGEMVFNGTVVDSGTSSGGTLELILQRLFTPGTHVVTVNVTSPAYCGSASLQISVNCGDDDDGSCITCFCGGVLCCIFWLLFIISLITMIVALARALCGVGTWWTFGFALALVIAFAVLLVAQCDVGICALLLVMAGSGFAGYGVVCGTNIIPSGCDLWLCKKTNVPATGTQVANLLLIDLVFTLIALVICAAIN